MTLEVTAQQTEPAPPPSDADAPPEHDQPVVLTPLRNGKRQPGTRVPPHDLAAEASLIGAILLSANAIEAATTAGLTATDFYKPAHGLIYTAATALHERGEPVDPVTVADELHRDGLLEQCGGPPALISLQAGTPAISNAARYAQIVRDFADLRSIIHAAGNIADLGYSLPDDVDAVLASASSLLTDVAVTRAASDASVSMFTDMAGVSTVLEPPILCPRTDNECCFIYPGRVHTLIGPSEAGKSWVAALWCKQLMDAGEHVVVLDWEDNAAGWKSRLRDMGADIDALEGPGALFHYAQRDNAWTLAERAELARSLEQWRPALVVVDAMTPALATEGLDDYRGVDIASFLADVTRVCRNAGAAVLIIDHVNKGDETQTGSHYKKGGIDGVQYKLKATLPMGRGKRGLSTLCIGKDRHGFLRGLTVGDDAAIGTLEVDSTGALHVEIAAPWGVSIGTRTAEGAFRPTGVMERASGFLAANPDGLTRGELRVKMKGNDRTRGDAIRLLLSEGYATEPAGGGARIVHVRPFSAAEDERLQAESQADLEDF